jgi:hypothetical protein
MLLVEQALVPYRNRLTVSIRPWRAYSTNTKSVTSGRIETIGGFDTAASGLLNQQESFYQR